MAKLDEIPLDEETSYNLGATALYNLIQETLPDHELVATDNNLPTKVTPYITLAVLNGSGFQDNGLGNKPIYQETKEDGSTVAVYQEKCQWRLRSYKDNAFFALKKVKSAMERYETHYKYFGNSGVIGLTSIGSVSRTPSVIDFQKVENSATMLVTLTYLHRYEDGEGAAVEGVDFGLKTVTSILGGEVIEDDVIIDPNNPPENP